MVRKKIDEPQCVITISDDEEEYESPYPECKKLREDNDSKPQDCINSDLPHSNGNGTDYEMADQLNTVSSDILSPHLTTPSESGNQTTVLGNGLGREEDAEVSSHCNETILKGPFTNLRCRSVRIGSLKVVPTSPVLLSSEGIVLKVPCSNVSDQSSRDPSITVTILSKQLLQFEAHFSRHLSVIFLYVTPTVSRQYSQKLGLEKNIHGGPFWDSLSTVESQKRLTLLPDCLDEAAKESMKQTFTRSGVFREISLAKANETLVKSSSVDTEGVQKSILTRTDWTLIPHSSKNSSNKENGFLKEVTLIFPC